MRPYLAAILLFGGTLMPVMAEAQISSKDFPAQVDLRPSSADDVLPATFRGEITYRGFYRGKVFVSAPIRQLSLNGLLNSALSSKSLPMAGDYTVVMRFDGNTVSGSTRAANSLSGRQGTPDPGRFTGRREGSTCYLTWNDGSDSIVYCGRSEYRQNDNVTNQQGQRYGFASRSTAAQFVDFVERDKLAAIANAKAQADRAKEVARLAALPKASPALASKFASFVQTDAKGWAFNRFDSGSVHNVRISEGTVKSGNFVMRGEYTYNGGSSGWVMAKIVAGSFDCIQFWDAMVGCRSLRTPEDGQNMRNSLANALDSGPAPSSGKMCYGSTDNIGQVIWVPC